LKGTYVNSDVGIILPTYCEAANIEKLIDEIESLRLDACILVIDDSSPDGTSNVVRMLQRDTKIFCFLCDLKAGSWNMGVAQRRLRSH